VSQGFEAGVERVDILMFYFFYVDVDVDKLERRRGDVRECGVFDVTLAGGGEQKYNSKT
jgi:hypothetical protein